MSLFGDQEFDHPLNGMTQEQVDARAQELEADLSDKERAALDLIIRYGGIDGAHHKTWTLDQVVRILIGEDKYEEFIMLMNFGEDGPVTYEWDTGIAP